jgi:hypothetical protein
MGVEIENSIESSLGVALPPASLIRARTIGQIVALLGEQMGAKKSDAPVSTSPTRITVPESASTDEVNLEALSDEQIEGLLGAEPANDSAADSQNALL